MNKKVLTWWCIASAIYANASLANTDIDLRLYEKRLISAHGQDGILQKIFSLIETPSGYYVEFEAGNGHFQSATKYLKKKYGWKGLLLDQVHDNPALNLHKESITPESVCAVLNRYSVPHDFDLAIINGGGMEFYIWRALSISYSPKIIVIRFNQDFNCDDDKVRKYDSSYQGTLPGASILALCTLGRYLGYSLVYQESTANNLFFIRNDLLNENHVTFKDMNDVAKLYTGTPKAINAADFASSLVILSHS